MMKHDVYTQLHAFHWCIIGLLKYKCIHLFIYNYTSTYVRPPTLDKYLNNIYICPYVLSQKNSTRVPLTKVCLHKIALKGCINHCCVCITVSSLLHALSLNSIVYSIKDLCKCISLSLKKRPIGNLPQHRTKT